MHIVKPDQTKIAVLKRNFQLQDNGQLGSDGTFVLYSYAPNFDGQASTDTDRDGASLYPYASLPDPPIVATPESGRYDVKLFKTSNDAFASTAAGT